MNAVEARRKAATCRAALAKALAKQLRTRIETEIAKKIDQGGTSQKWSCEGVDMSVIAETVESLRDDGFVVRQQGRDLEIDWAEAGGVSAG